MIPKDKLVWRGLFENPKAIYYIEKYLCQWYPEYLQIVEHEQDSEDDPDSEDEILDVEDCDFPNDHEDSEKEFVKALSNNPNADHLLDIFIIFFLRKVETLFISVYSNEIKEQ